MRTLTLLSGALSLTLLSVPIHAEDRSDAGSPLPAVDFLTARPVIDGSLDANLRSLPMRLFDTVETTSDLARVSAASYRLGYTNDGLYLYIATAKGELASRDRAYQNGDGFHMVLGIPTPDGSPTRQFLVLAFSPLDPLPRRRAFVWYRNVDLAFTRLINAECAVASHDGRSGIELFLPWRSIPPYHPWLSDAIGFNLCFVEASGDKEKAYHFALLDERIQSEQHPRRYRLLPFAAPPPSSQTQLALALTANHLFTSDPLSAVVAGISPGRQPVSVQFAVLDNDSVLKYTHSVSITLSDPSHRTTVSLGPVPLPPDTYIVRWSSAHPDASGEAPLTILPTFDRQEFTSRINRIRATVARGSASTLQFLLEQIVADLSALRPYDSGRALLREISSLDTLLAHAQQGFDVLAHRTGILRRAYRSAIDNSLQPYTVKIPKSYSPSHPVPLIVYLHGSGQDDQGHFDYDSTDDGFIHLAPRGRGTSNVYTTDHAQDDIRETIDDVCRNYSVDTTRIVLTGFSMGGYGVYRTFVEMPKRFCALAIFSGSPNMATLWLGEGYPDFSTLDSVRPFKGTRMFVFHGGKDRNVPVEYTDSLVVNLRKVGALVEYVREEERGHDAPSTAGQKQYREWLRSVTDR